jgi:N-acetylmuramoyl-L-alanine amidase
MKFSSIRNRCFALLAILGFAAPVQAGYFRTVVIDPGHGGHDLGGQWGRVYEKHLCLDTAARLQSYLDARGFKTVMTRDSDFFVSLPERVAIANRCRDAIFVAVHYNFTPKESVGGLETYYCTPQSVDLARYAHDGIIRHLREENRGVKFARFYVIRYTTCPSILVECGFVSNSGERDSMKAAWYRQAIAEGIGEGVIRFRRN